MSLEILNIFVYLFAALSLTANCILVWYIRKIMTIHEDTTAELAENINAFQGELEKLLDTDVLAGEPTLMKLLDDVRQFGSDTEEIRTRLIPEEEGN